MSTVCGLDLWRCFHQWLAEWTNAFHLEWCNHLISLNGCWLAGCQSPTSVCSQKLITTCSPVIIISWQIIQSCLSWTKNLFRIHLANWLMGLYLWQKWQPANKLQPVHEVGQILSSSSCSLGSSACAGRIFPSQSDFFLIRKWNQNEESLIHDDV